jgi:hypothetical protein
MGKAGVYFLTVILFFGLSNAGLSQNNKEEIKIHHSGELQHCIVNLFSHIGFSVIKEECVVE